MIIQNPFFPTIRAELERVTKILADRQTAAMEMLDRFDCRGEEDADIMCSQLPLTDLQEVQRIFCGLDALCRSAIARRPLAKNMETK